MKIIIKERGLVEIECILEEKLKQIKTNKDNDLEENTTKIKEHEKLSQTIISTNEKELIHSYSSTNLGCERYAISVDYEEIKRRLEIILKFVNFAVRMEQYVELEDNDIQMIFK